LRTLNHFNHGADQVSLFTPELQQAAPMIASYRVPRGAQVKNHTAIFKQRSRRMVNQVLFDASNEPLG
jgi:hypothetical protein